MKALLFSTSAAILFLTGAAQAQTSDMATGPTWPDSARTALFADDTLESLRSDDEITAQWVTLPAEDQDSVRQMCTAHSADSASIGGAATAGASDAPAETAADTGTATETGTDATTETTTDGTATNDMAGVSTTAVSAENMSRICALIETL